MTTCVTQPKIKTKWNIEQKWKTTKKDFTWKALSICVDSFDSIWRFAQWEKSLADFRLWIQLPRQKYRTSITLLYSISKIYMWKISHSAYRNVVTSILQQHFTISIWFICNFTGIVRIFNDANTKWKTALYIVSKNQQKKIKSRLNSINFYSSDIFNCRQGQCGGVFGPFNGE